MTATLEQTQSDLLRLVELVQQGEEVVITNRGQAVARLSSMPQSAPMSNRQAWLLRLADLRQQLSTGQTGSALEQIIEEDRGD